MTDKANNKTIEEGLKDLELRSEEVQDILTRVPGWMIRWGSLLFLFLIVLLLFLSWMIKYPDIIASEATITTRIPPQKEYAKTSGKLAVILVKDGDAVAPGTPLAVIENTANYEDVFLIQAVMDTLQVQKSSFKFPFDELPLLFLGAMEAEYSLFENNYIQYQLNKELQPFSNQETTDALIASETKVRLEALQSQQNLSRSELRFKKKELTRYQKLHEKGIISEQEYETKQLDYLGAKKAYRDLGIAISQLKEGVGNADKNIKDTQINRTREELQLLKKVVQSYQQLKKALKDWQHQYVLQSDIAGKVSFMNVWNKNQNVIDGELVFTIIPTANSEYIAKLKTPAHNSGKIKTGQMVNIKLANYPDTEFGMLKGAVNNIALIPDTEGRYSIDVALTDSLTTTYNKQIAFKHEMPAIAEIITEDLRLIERFFYQFKELMNR